MRNKYAGVTLLFTYKADKIIEAQLKSYIVCPINRYDLNKKIDSIRKNEIIKGANFIGVYDIFYVSEKFQEGAVLGTSYIREYRSLTKAQTLVKKDRKFDYQEAKEKNVKWCLVSLVYFYEDPVRKHNLAITCLTPIKKESLVKMRSKIKLIGKSHSFKRKIFTVLDKLDSKSLRFVGIEEIAVIRENPSTNGAYQILYKDYKSISSVKKILPSKAELRKKVWW